MTLWKSQNCQYLRIRRESKIDESQGVLKNYLFLAALDLGCCTEVFSSCHKPRLVSSWGAWAFLVEKHCL